MGGEGHSEDLTGQLWKLDPNESVILDRFYFVMWYVDEEISMEFSEEEKTGGLGLQSRSSGSSVINIFEGLCT